MGSYGITNERWEELLEHREEKNAEKAEKKATAMELLEKADIRGKISHDDPELDFEYIQDGVYENSWRYRYYVVFKGIKLYDYDITITTDEADKRSEEHTSELQSR